jgi:tetratricopeptide (TPR) repeat protein
MSREKYYTDKAIRTYRSHSKKKRRYPILRTSLTGTLALVIILCFTTITHENGDLPVGNYNFMKMLKKSVQAPDKDEKSDPLKIADLLSQCKKCFKAQKLTTGEGLTALECYQQVLGMDSDNPEARAGLEKIASKYTLWAKAALERKQLEKTDQYLKGLAMVNPESSDLIRMRAHLRELQDPPGTEAERQMPDMTNPPLAENQDQIISPQVSALLAQCKIYLRAKQLTTGKRGTALGCYQEVLRQSPENPEAQAGLKKIEKQYILWTNKALRNKRAKNARQYLNGLLKVNPRSPDLAKLRQRLAELESSSPKKAEDKTSGVKRRKYKKTDTLTDISLGAGFQVSD